MTKAEESQLGKLVTQVAVLNTNFDNHIEGDTKHREYMKKKMEHITEKIERIDDLDIAVNGTKVEKFQDGLVAKVNIHKEYHEGNEEKWGFQKYLKNHLKVFAILIIVGIFLLSLVGYNINTIATAALKSIGVKIELPEKKNE